MRTAFVRLKDERCILNGIKENIADRAAQATLNACFTNPDGFFGHGVWPDMSARTTSRPPAPSAKAALTNATGGNMPVSGADGSGELETRFPPMAIPRLKQSACSGITGPLPGQSDMRSGCPDCGSLQQHAKWCAFRWVYLVKNPLPTGIGKATKAAYMQQRRGEFSSLSEDGRREYAAGMSNERPAGLVFPHPDWKGRSRKPRSDAKKPAPHASSSASSGARRATSRSFASVAASTAASSAASLPSSNITLLGSDGSKISRGTPGDFKWEIDQNYRPRALYIFNDNALQHGGVEEGGGNAVIRPYNRHGRMAAFPRGAGVCTGPKPGGGQGYAKLTVPSRKQIDSDIAEIRVLLATGYYDTVVYSTDANGDLGTQILIVGQTVKAYIVQELRRVVTASRFGVMSSDTKRPSAPGWKRRRPPSALSSSGSEGLHLGQICQFHEKHPQLQNVLSSLRN